MFKKCFIHLADAFIQSDLQCIQAIHFFYQYLIKQITYLVLCYLLSDGRKTDQSCYCLLFSCSYKLNVPIIKHRKYVYIKCHINIISKTLKTVLCVKYLKRAIAQSSQEGHKVRQQDVVCLVCAPITSFTCSDLLLFFTSRCHSTKACRGLGM